MLVWTEFPARFPLSCDSLGKKNPDVDASSSRFKVPRRYLLTDFPDNNKYSLKAETLFDQEPVRSILESRFSPKTSFSWFRRVFTRIFSLSFYTCSIFNNSREAAWQKSGCWFRSLREKRPESFTLTMFRIKSDLRTAPKKSREQHSSCQEIESWNPDDATYSSSTVIIQSQ